MMRSNCLNFALGIIENLEVKSKTRDLILYLVDIMLVVEKYNPSKPELLCISSIFFVLKLEDDFSKNFHNFFKMLLDSIKIKMADIMNYEILILSNLPSIFILLPNFK